MDAHDRAELMRKARFVFRQHIARQIAEIKHDKADELLGVWVQFCDGLEPRQTFEDKQRLCVTSSVLADTYLREIQEALNRNEGDSVKAGKLTQFIGIIYQEDTRFLRHIREHEPDLAHVADLAAQRLSVAPAIPEPDGSGMPDSAALAGLESSGAVMPGGLLNPAC